MKTILDDTEYIYWFPESASIQGGTFRLVLLEAPKVAAQDRARSLMARMLKGADIIDVIKDHKRKIIVEFEHVLFTQAFNEFARNLDNGDSREPHILGRHSDSALKKWVKEYTVLFDTDAKEDEITHWSVLTTNNIYHVLTDKEPKVYEERDAQPCNPATADC